MLIPGSIAVGFFIAILPSTPIIGISILVGKPAFWVWPIFGVLLSIIVWINFMTNAQ